MNGRALAALTQINGTAQGAQGREEIILAEEAFAADAAVRKAIAEKKAAVRAALNRKKFSN